MMIAVLAAVLDGCEYSTCRDSCDRLFPVDEDEHGNDKNAQKWGACMGACYSTSEG